MKNTDYGIEDLLDLEGERFIVDDALGLWVKFEVKKIERTSYRPHGIRYSITLHDRQNTRLMGFDNAHNIRNKIGADKPFDHWHRTISDSGRPYPYETASKLLIDFWNEVDRIVKKLKGEI